jgi:hypothetical protein
MLEQFKGIIKYNKCCVIVYLVLSHDNRFCNGYITVPRTLGNMLQKAGGKQTENATFLCLLVSFVLQ